MMFDILAIQAMYGKNTNYKSGDTTYTYTETGDYHQTLWDSGGKDTIVYNSTKGGIIDLGQGHAYGSRLGTKVIAWDWEDMTGTKDKVVDNIWIAYGTVIENASGGDGSDTLLGNEVANVLRGRLGNDVLNGGVGNDALNGGNGKDSIDGAAGDDEINGGNGADALQGGLGVDAVHGGNGPDTLDDPDGDVGLDGGRGPDLINGLLEVGGHGKGHGKGKNK